MANPLLREGAIEEREFQTNISEKAKARNTLVVLPTATGKTIIAALVASHFLYNYGDKKVLMMAPTRPLVHALAQLAPRVRDEEAIEIKK